MGSSTMRSKALDLFDDLLLIVAPSFVWFCAGVVLGLVSLCCRKCPV